MDTSVCLVPGNGEEGAPLRDLSIHPLWTGRNIKKRGSVEGKREKERGREREREWMNEWKKERRKARQTERERERKRERATIY
jgi:hypothetical protein